MEAKGKTTNQDGLTVVMLTPDKMGSTAALDSSVFKDINITEPVPKAWEDRARLAWEFYTTEPIVSNVVNTWLAFAVGDDIRLSCDDEKVLEEAQAAFSLLGLDAWVRDMVLQLLVKGDTIGYFRLAKDQTDLEEVMCLNPASCKVKYTDGLLEKVEQFPELLSGLTTLTEGTELPLEQIVHRKWNAPGFSQRGNSMVLPAFQSIELIRAYRKAEQAIAKRWTTPLRFIKVGGKFGDKLIMPTQPMIKKVRAEMSQMDIKSGLVVPFWVSAETYGNEGQVLDTESKVKEIKEDIVVALGLAKSLVTGDGPNFATASVSLRKMLIQVKQIRQAARNLLHWVMDKWLEVKGWQDRELEFIFTDLNIDDQTEMKRLLLEMYDRGLVSKKTVQVMMELNPDIEQSNRSGEQIVDKDWSVQDIVQMVQLGIMSVSSAQQLLGLDGEKEAESNAAELRSDLDALYTRAQNSSALKMCDDCLHFDENTNQCQAQEIEVPFDTPACVLFSTKNIQLAENRNSPVNASVKSSAATSSPAKGKLRDGDNGCGCNQ